MFEILDHLPYQTASFVGLIWVQSVCKGYEQTILVGNELQRGKGCNT